MLDFCIRGQTSLTTPVSTPTVVLISCRGDPCCRGCSVHFLSPRLFTTRSARPTHSRCETCTLHRQALITVGEKARHAATGFTDMDDGNAAELKAVVCSCAT